MTKSVSERLKTGLPQIRKLAAGMALAVGVGLLAPAAMAQSHGGGGHGGGGHGGGNH